MTNAEAIKLLELAKAEIEWEYSLEYQGAFDMAIKALEQADCEDCISRKDLLKKCVYAPIAPVVKGNSVHYEKIIFERDIINAEPIHQEPKEDILDKIRTEIEQEYIDDGAMQEYTVERCLDIIDKYKEG